MITTIKKEKILALANLSKTNTKQKDQIMCYTHSLMYPAKEKEIKKEKALAEIRKALSEKGISWA